MRSRRSGTVAAFVATVGLAACGGSTSADPGAHDAWARPAPPGAEYGVVYLTLVVTEDDTLVGARVAPSVAESAAVYTGAMVLGAGHHGGGGGSEGGHHETDVDLAAGEELVFEPGGNHVMLEGLTAPLERGDRFDLILDLAVGEDLVTEVVVADNPPA